MDVVGAMDVAAKSGNFRSAVDALNKGDLNAAGRHLFGPGNEGGNRGFFAEVVDQRNEKAALLFRDSYYARIREALDRIDQMQTTSATGEYDK
ncbi:MAG TPA: hypothetical protein DDZ51_00710 [Planctomycetaceae bacterium]|nr:hypothetical protein [Planctomycetaceae bacterium]